MTEEEILAALQERARAEHGPERAEAIRLAPTTAGLAQSTALVRAMPLELPDEPDFVRPAEPV